MPHGMWLILRVLIWGARRIRWSAMAVVGATIASARRVVSRRTRNWSRCISANSRSVPWTRAIRG
jgi:hypothetical protein